MEQSKKSLSELSEQCDRLLYEISSVRQLLKKRWNKIENLSAFHDRVEKESGFIKKAASGGQFDEHRLRSSNLSHDMQVWKYAIHSKGLQSIQNHAKIKIEGRRTTTVRIDVISEKGLLWTKVANFKVRRLEYELAENDVAQSSEEEDEDEGEEVVLEDVQMNGHSRMSRSRRLSEVNELAIVKSMRRLCAARDEAEALDDRPQIELYLPGMVRGETQVVELLERALTQMKIRVIFGPEMYDRSGRSDEQAYSELVEQLSPMDQYGNEATPQNETSVNLVLVSDICHERYEQDVHQSLKSQIEEERLNPILPNLVYPRIANLGMSFVEDALASFNEIVNKLGTPSEKRRAEILFGGGTVEDFQTLSIHRLPNTIVLPVKLVPYEAPDTLPQFVSWMKSDRAHKIFCRGWYDNMTTLTGNKSVAKQFRQEQGRLEECTDRPNARIFLHPSRSLMKRDES